MSTTKKVNALRAECNRADKMERELKKWRDEKLVERMNNMEAWGVGVTTALTQQAETLVELEKLLKEGTLRDIESLLERMDSLQERVNKLEEAKEAKEESNEANLRQL